MKVNKIAIACFKNDLHLLRACIGSIHYWHPEIEIYLIKDYIRGKFSTKEMEKAFGVKIFPTQRRYFGWPWSKLAVILHEPKEKYFFLDSDVVLLGKVIDKLNQFDDDFIITGIQTQDRQSPTFNAHYIDVKKLEEFDPTYKFPGYGFNGGHIVMTSGLLTEDDFRPVIEFKPHIRNKYPAIFKHGDQGVLNYVFAKVAQQGKIKTRFEAFWIWPGLPFANEVDLENIKKGEGIPYVMHWAGIKTDDFRKFPRYDILKFYENYYYSKVKGGKLRQHLSYFRRLGIAKLKILKQSILDKKFYR